MSSRAPPMRRGHTMRKREVPKHLQRKSSTPISVLLPRAKRRARNYFSPRATGESVHEWVQRNMEESLGAYLFDSFMAILSSFVVLFYVYVNWQCLAISMSGWIYHVDMTINLIFTAEFLFRVYAAFDRIDYLIRFFTIVEFIVLIPSWATPPGSMNESQYLRILRAMRVLRAHRFLEFTNSSLQREILSVLLTVVAIIVGTTGIVQILEACHTRCVNTTTTIDLCLCQDLSYLNWLYFAVVSISTLGYGDIVPESTKGKFFISFIILLTFVLGAILINRVSAIVSSHAGYSSSYTEGKQHPHVVITGHIDVEVLSVFFGEFFHSNNLNWNEKIVILNPSPPTLDVKKMLNIHENKVQYIVGSPMLDEDLTRAMMHEASACYVLVNRNAKRPQHADQCSALITIALRRGNPKCPIYTQVINAENANAILNSGATDVVVVGLLKLSILARSCELYGLPTLLLNLLAQCHGDLDNRHSPMQWQKPYVHGYMHGIYLVDIPRTFSGLTYGDLIRFLYDRTNVVPLAMLTEDGVQFVDMDFKLGGTADPTLCCKVYAIAKGLATVEDVMHIPPEQVLSYRKTIRRKAKSMKDLSEEELLARKKTKPALGDEFEQIRQSLMRTYANMSESQNADYLGLDYDIFTTIGAPVTIANHIVVCGFPSDTFTFIKTIREAPLKNENVGSPPVVFLAPAVIDEEHYARVRCFRDVYFVHGSPVNFADLKKTRIDVCSAVLILTTATESLYADSNMIDADAITTLRYIVEISQRTRMPNLVVELDKSTNVKLLSSLANDRRASATLSLPIITNRQLSYRTPRRTSARRDSFWGGMDEGGMRSTESALALEEYIVSGRVYMNSIIDALMSECYRKQWITQFIHVLVNGSSDDDESRRLFQLRAPEELISISYSTCFRRFLDQANCTCIGIWRPERGMILPHPCVFLNPPPEMQIEPGDHFFLVGPPISEFAAFEMFGPSVGQ